MFECDRTIDVSSAAHKKVASTSFSGGWDP